MNKIICEVCGTRYPDTAEQCPICGFVKENTENEPEQEIQEEVVEVPSRPAVPGGRFSKANVRKRLKNQAAYAEEEERSRVAEEEAYESEEDDENEDEEESGKGNTVLNVLLVLVIVALLAVSALIFVRYVMPDVFDKTPATEPTEAYVEQTDAPTELVTEAPIEEATEEADVPCDALVLEETEVTLREVGAMHLLNIQVLPEDTTDEIIFFSSNNDVATVNGEGRITAVAEGSVIITAICGEQQLECSVVCDFSPEEEATEAPTEAPTEAGVTKTVTSNYVNIRSGAGTGYEKVGEYKKGDVVTIYEEKTVGGRPWGRTDKGWICTEYVK